MHFSGKRWSYGRTCLQLVVGWAVCVATSSCGLPLPWEWAGGGAAVGKWARKPLMGTIQLPCGGNKYDDIITIIQALWNLLTIFSFSSWVHMSGSESLDYLKSVGKYSVSSWKIYIIARFFGKRVFKIKINTHILQENVHLHKLWHLT